MATNTTAGQLRVKSFMKTRLIASLGETLLYLITPESSLQTGFNNNSSDYTDSVHGMRRIVKMAFCVLLSILLTSMIATLV